VQMSTEALKSFLGLRAKFDDWASRKNGEVRYDELVNMTDKEFFEIKADFTDSFITQVLKLLLSEYVDELKAQFGAEPTVQKLAVVHRVLTSTGVI
jgi:hypothetical protein